MAEGGPETNLALGQPDIEAAINEAADTGVSAPAIPGAPDPASSGAEAGYTLKGSLKEQPMPNVRLTNQDFYGQPNPDTIQTRTGPVTVPSFGQVPLAISAMQLRESQQERRKVQDAIKNFDLYQGIGKAPDPYQKNFRNLATADMDKFLADAVKMHGGDRPAAIKELLDPSSDLSRAWKNRAANWETTGQQAQYKFDQAKGWLDKYETGKIQGTPEEAKAASDALNAIGEFGGPNGSDVMELSKSIRRFDEVMSRAAYVNDFALPNIEAHMRETGIAPKTTRNRFGQKITTYGTEKDLAPFREQLARDMAYRGIGDGKTMQERIQSNADYLERTIPSDEEIKVDIANPPAPSGSSSSEGKLVMGDSEYGPDWSQNITRDDVESGKPVASLYRTPMANIVGGRPEPMKERPFKGASGQPLNIRPSDIAMDEDGNEFIIGQDPAYQELESSLDDVKSQVSELDKIINEGVGVKENSGGHEYTKEDIAAAKASKATALGKINTTEKRLAPAKAPLGPNMEAAKLFFGAENVAAAREKNMAARDARSGAGPTPSGDGKPSKNLDYFKDGKIVAIPDKDGKKIYFISRSDGMDRISEYFDDEESAKLVKKAFDRGEVLPEHVSKTSKRAIAAMGGSSSSKYTIKGKEYTLDELKSMGYDEAQIAAYKNK